MDLWCFNTKLVKDIPPRNRHKLCVELKEKKPRYHLDYADPFVQSVAQYLGRRTWHQVGKSWKIVLDHHGFSNFGNWEAYLDLIMIHNSNLLMSGELNIVISFLHQGMKSAVSDWSGLVAVQLAGTAASS